MGKLTIIPLSRISFEYISFAMYVHLLEFGINVTSAPIRVQYIPYHPKKIYRYIYELALLCIECCFDLNRALFSKNMTLGLLDADDPDISPHDHRYDAKSPNGGTSDQHHHLRVPVGTLNGDTSRRAHRVR